MSERKSPHASTAATRLELVFTVTERYYVTDDALAQIAADSSDRDEALIELFELHNGSP